ncbi:MAG: hypothetical protein IJ365_00605 [Clostridia bacterium]|nr:hypothetical protein [Clostridia bacterium]
MKNKIFVIIFIVLCIIPTALMLVPGTEGSDANEAPKELPSLINTDGGLNINYLSQFSEWFDNSIGLRSHMISAHNKIIASVFGESAEDKVILGKDGWLFYTETLSDYKGTNLMSGREIYSISRSLELIDEYCASRGINFAFTVAPNKNSLYGDKMPDSCFKSQKPTNAQLLTQQLSAADINYINMFDAFGGESRPLYRKTDSHWTYEGAGLAADKLLTALGKDFEPYFGGETYQLNAKGDLHKMIYPALPDKDEEIRFTRELSYEYTKPMRSVEDNFIYTHSEGKSGNLFMFRDSFGNTLHEYMANEFENAVFCRLIPYNLTLAEQNGADTLIIEIVERNLKWLIENPAVFAAPQRTPRKARMQDITSIASISCDIANELDGYCKIEGSIPTDTIPDNSNIYITANGVTYEATPCGNGFTAYLPGRYTVDMLKIYSVQN